MASHRLYCLDGAGRISLADWIRAADDEDAVRQARLMKNRSLECEVWRGDRLVATLNVQDVADG